MALRRLCRIAEGGMGVVELALRQEGRFRRLYAVKRPHRQLRDDGAFRAMFMDEARLAGLIRHPNVVSVHDVGADDEGPFLVMDYVDGVSLAAIIRGLEPMDAPLPLALCLAVTAQVARGLHAAHEVRGDDGSPLGLVHRDVSPQNILVGFDGVVRVTDFGIAKALGNVNRTATGLLKGNVGYMSPEQLRFEEADRRSDLFSLGVVLYEALGRRRLYRNTDANLIARRILSEPPPDLEEIRADVPPELVQLVFELLAKERDLRPATAMAVAERLEALPSVDDGLPFALTTFLVERFGAQQAERRALIEEAMARVTAEVETPTPVTTSGRRPAGRVRAVAALGVAVAAGAALILGTRPAPPVLRAAPLITAVAPARAPAVPAAPPTAVAPAVATSAMAGPTDVAARGRRMRARRAPTSVSTTPRAVEAPGLVRLPRAHGPGSRKLDVPIATDWQ